MNIPEGWPTEEMQLAGAQAIRIDTTPINKLWTARKVFEAMLVAAPTPPAQDKAMVDYNEPAMESSWQYLKTQLSSKDWTTGEAFTYMGFFAWGWEARRQYDAPAQHGQPVGCSDGYGTRIAEYRTPADYKLRKAAEEVARRYAQVIAIGAPAGLVEAVRNLHSALEER